MLILPGEDEAQYVIDKSTKKILFKEPTVAIGSWTRCKINKVWPTHLELQVTHINGEKVTVPYRAVHKLDHINQDTDSFFLNNVYSCGSIFEGKIVSYGDNFGLVISGKQNN